MNNLDKTYAVLLQDILDNHTKISNEELDIKLKEYYNSIPYDCDVFSPKLNEIVMSRFSEGTHWKRYKITL
jgi:hypothetical protein